LAVAEVVVELMVMEMVRETGVAGAAVAAVVLYGKLLQ
jgi:hypothetical protein